MKQNIHVLLELVQVVLLVGQPLLQFQKLLLLALTDGVILAGLLTALEGIAVHQRSVLASRTSPVRADLPLATGLGRRAGVSLSHHAGGRRERSAEGTESGRLSEGRAKHGCGLGGELGRRATLEDVGRCDVRTIGCSWKSWVELGAGSCDWWRPIRHTRIPEQRAGDWWVGRYRDNRCGRDRLKTKVACRLQQAEVVVRALQSKKI